MNYKTFTRIFTLESFLHSHLFGTYKYEHTCTNDMKLPTSDIYNATVQNTTQNESK